VTILLLAALALAPSTAAGHTDGVEAFVRVMHSVDLGVDDVQRAAFARELAALPGAVELHLATTLAGALPAAAGGEGQPLAREHWALLARAADELPRAEVVALATRGLEQGPDVEWRAAVLDLLGRTCGADELRLLVRLAGDARTGDPVIGEFELAAGRLFRRDPAALQALEELTLIPEPAAFELIGVVGATCGAEGVDWLLEQLQDDESVDRALQALARVAPSVPLDRAPELAATLRPQLGAESAITRRQAMRVLTGLQDEAAIPRLVELLASGETGEAPAAGRALGELTGRELPADAAVWGAWLARELEWWGARGEAALEERWSEDARTAVAAVNEISVRGLLRDRLSRELARVLREHPLPQVREQACLGLTQLRSRAACVELVAALEAGDEELAALACRALRSITGEAQACDARVWRAALALSSR
jgi:hypothetical protein